MEPGLHLTKRHCSESNTQAIQNTTPQSHSYSGPFKNIPKGVLQYNFVSYLSFLEQTMSLACVSKAFNELADFARETQDWKDHVVDVPGILYLYTKNIYLQDYLKWQKSKKTSQLVKFNTFEIFLNKIESINRLANVNTTFIKNVLELALQKLALTKGQDIKLKLKEIHFNLSASALPALDRTFEKFSIMCPELMNLTVNFNHTIDIVSAFSSPYKFFDGLANFIERCNHVKLHITYLKEKSDFHYMTQTIEQCVSLNPNFAFPLASLSTLLNPDDDWCPLIERCPQLNVFKANANRITESFVYSLSRCFQLTYIDLRNATFEANNKENFSSQFDHSFSQLFKNCIQLRTFEYLNHLSLGDSTFQSIASHPNLEDITISITPSAQILKSTSTCTSLKKFHLYSNFDFKPPMEGHSKEISEDVNQTIIAIAQCFPSLVEFNSSAINFIPQQSQPITLLDNTMAKLSTLPNLSTVSFKHIHHSSISSFNNLDNCPHLHRVKFNILKPLLCSEKEILELKNILSEKFELVYCYEDWLEKNLEFSYKPK